MSSHNKKLMLTSALRSSTWFGVVAASGLLLGCISDAEDELPEDVEGGVDIAEARAEALAAGDPVIVSSSTGTAQNGSPGIRVPNGTAAGDLLLLFLHRTDDGNFWDGPTQLKGRMSPWRGGWQGPVASCAVFNGPGDAPRDFDCKGREADLNQVLYWKKATTEDLRKDGSQYEKLTVNFPGSHPAWAIMATVRNAETGSNPVRAWKGQTKCDKVRGTRFPTVSGNSRDLLLLSQSYDDGKDTGVKLGSFPASSGFSRVQILDNDEAGHLYSRVLTTTGATPEYEMEGGSGSLNDCKDLAVSIVIKKAGT